MEERKPKILVAPLNWGLGHSTRVIPIILELLKRNAEVIIAADGRPLDLLRKEFPQLNWVRLKGYDIHYQRSGSFAWQIFLQTPKILSSISYEKEWLTEWLTKEKIDAVITDNRFGLWHETIPCIFISHQIKILLPSMLKWLERIMLKWNMYYIKRFRECWIPDFKDAPNLTGKLSHGFFLPENYYFIGPLSRMEAKPTTPKKYDVLFILSGQEPQRTVFEELLTEQARHLSLKMLMVRGVTEGNSIASVTKNFMKVDCMTTQQLNEAMAAADLIVARSGYSTVMDVVAMGKKALFIPTPGQTEQEYLSRVYMEQKSFYSVKQSQIHLKEDVQKALQYPGMPIRNSGRQLSERIDFLMQKVTRHEALMPAE